MENGPLITVVETEVYLQRAAKRLSEDQREAIKIAVAADPTRGEALGSGVYKFRWAIEGQGKRGGVRVVHLFMDKDHPIVLLDVFSKNEQANYSAAELKAIRAIAKEIAAAARNGS